MRTGMFAAWVLLCAALAPAAPARAQAVVEEVAALAPATLRPGQYVWYAEPRLIRTGSSWNQVTIVVSIADQRAYVYQGGRLVAASTVSTGSRGHETPVGEFTILQKKPFHRSNLYSNAPMPWMQRLTWDGIAIHAGHLPGYPASHGCIRLPAAFARQLYALTAMGGNVSIVAEPVADPAIDRYGPPIPLLTADTRNLGGAAFDMVTMAGDPPLAPRPASWTAEPAREIVQPIPTGSK